MVVGSEDDERAHTRRYTEDGINVVALDRHGRGLHRARPERRFPTVKLTRAEPSRLPTVIFVLVLLGILGLVLSRQGWI